MIQRWCFGSTLDGRFLPYTTQGPPPRWTWLLSSVRTVPPCPTRGAETVPPTPARARQGRVGQLLWQWRWPKPRAPFLNVRVIRGQCIFTSVICMELLPLSNLKLSTFYFKMTLQVLLCDIHFNSALILHNSHMIQCVCFMRQTWHMKIKTRFLIWNAERNCRGKKKKQWERAPRDQGGGKRGGKNRMRHQSHFILPRVKTAFISMKDN